MKPIFQKLLWVLLIWAGTLSAQETDKPVLTPGTNALRHALSFTNGDLLYGRLVSIDPKQGVQWRHPDVLEPVRFKTENLTEIQLAAQPGPETASPYPCIVHLRNLDEMEGNLISLDASQLVLQTWYAGKIVIPRSEVRVLVPVPRRLHLVYDGPTGMEGWTQAKSTAPMNEVGEWYYRNGAFYATHAASLARKLNLPPVASIEFDMTWRGALNVAIALYTDSLQPISLRSKETEPDFAGFYSLQMNTYSVNLLMVNKPDPLKNLGQVIVPTFSQKNNAHITLKVSKEDRSITLLIDDVIVKQWIDDQKFNGEGSGMRFVHQGQGALKISNLHITEWDGRFEEKITPNTNSSNDLALLLNRDKVAGTLRNFHDGKLNFALPQAAIDVPIQRIAQLVLADGPPKDPHPIGEDIRAYFEYRGSLTFKLERWDEKKVVGISPVFGRFEADPKAFGRIEFPTPNN